MLQNSNGAHHDHNHGHNSHHHHHHHHHQQHHHHSQNHHSTRNDNHHHQNSHNNHSHSQHHHNHHHSYHHHHDDHRKQNHCEIEKRRRDKMNHYIMELASVIPSFTNNHNALVAANNINSNSNNNGNIKNGNSNNSNNDNSQSQKLDKLTVLRMAVQHVKSLRSSLCSFSSFHLRPSFLSSGNLLKNLILQMASQEAQDNLFMVVTCDRGKVLFVSQSSKDILHHEQNELVGQCLFDILHKDDVSKVKEQISYFSLMPKQMLIDSKTLQPIKNNQRQSFAQLQNQANSTPQPGARRSFFCRMRSGPSNSGSGGGGGVAGGGGTSFKAPSDTEAGQQLAENKIIGDRCGNKRSSERTDEDDKMANNLRQQQRSTNTISASDGTKKSKSRLQTNKSDRIDKKTNSSNAAPTNGHARIKEKNSTILLADDVDENSGINRTTCDDGNTGDNSNKISPENIPNTRDMNEANDLGTSDDCDEPRKTNGRDGGQSSASKRSISSSSSSSSIKNSDNNSENNNKADRDTKSPSPNGGSGGSCSGVSSRGDVESKESLFSTSSPSCSSSSPPLPASSRKKHRRYVVMHCTGYLKSITLRNDECDDDDGYYNDNSDDEDNDQCKTINCLVAVFRRSVMDRDLKPDRPLTFTCRYSMEGKFAFVDQRTTIALGYMPQQLLGTSHYAYCHKDSVDTFKECHRQCILNSEAVSSDIYQFKRANGQYLWLQTSLKSFRNPWTKFIDYIVANHTTAEGNNPRYNEGCVPTKFNQDMTGEASQSSSPASASSSPESLPSVDSKKSASSSSSSIGSCYSMDSYASGGSIRALLSHIDKIKSGETKYSFDYPRKRGDRHAVGSTSGGSSTSATKSNDDSGNFSDLQSCSSVSSQNSGLSSEFLHTMTGVTNNFVNNVQANSSNSDTPTPPTGATNNRAALSYYNQTKQTAGYRQPQPQGVCNSLVDYQQSTRVTPTKTQQQQQQPCLQVICPPPSSQPARDRNLPNETYTRVASDNHNLTSTQMDKDDGPTNRLALERINCPMIGSIKPNQRPEYQYPYRKNQTKGGSINSSISTHSDGSWNGSSGSVYSARSHNGGSNPTDPNTDRQLQQQQAPNSREVMKDSSTCDMSDVRDQEVVAIINKLQEENNKQQTYLMQSDQMQTRGQMSSMQAQMPMQSIQTPEGYGSHCNETYQNDLMQPVVGSYITNNDSGAGGAGNNVCQRYSANDVDMNQMMQMTPDANELQQNVGMTMNQQPQEQREQNQQQKNQIQGHNNNHNNNNNLPMIWNTPANSGNIYHNMLMPQGAPSHQIDMCHRRGSVGLQGMDVSNQPTGGNSMIGQHQQQQQQQQHHHQNHHQQEQTIQCPHCPNHKCCPSSNQSYMMGNNTDLNTLNLTSLAVEGDLDEVELLECLAVCEPPENQLYNIHNNSYQHYNM